MPAASRPRLVTGNTHPPLASAERATMMASDGRAPGVASASMATAPDAPLFGGAAAAAVGMTPLPVRAAQVGSRTQPGFHPAGPGPERMGPPVPRAPAGASTQLSFASLVGRTMPLGLQLGTAERAVLDALGRAPAIGAHEIARIAGTDDPVGWMGGFIAKLAELGLDIVHAGQSRTGEPTYILRR